MLYSIIERSLEGTLHLQLLYGHCQCIFCYERNISFRNLFLFSQSREKLGSMQQNYNLIYIKGKGFGGLGVACWPLVPKFAGSNPAEAVGFLRAKKSSARLPSEGK